MPKPTPATKPAPATRVQRPAARQSQTTTTARSGARFVRRDADAVFREAFDGKTLASILFEARLRKANRTAAPPRPPSEPGPAHTQPDGSAEMTAALEDVILRRAQRLADQYGPEALQHTTIHRYTPTAKPPPGSHIPFRPFVGMSVPEGCTAETELPRFEPEPQPDASDVQLDDPLPQTATPWWKSTVDPTERALGKLQEIGAAAHGKMYSEGQLYSYHRPY